MAVADILNFASYPEKEGLNGPNQEIIKQNLFINKIKQKLAFL